jgi:hypothetical protein
MRAALHLDGAIKLSQPAGSETAGLIDEASRRGGPPAPTAEVLDLGGGASLRDQLSTSDKLRFAAALALNALPADLVLTQAPFIFQAYYRADPALLGLVGAAMGLYNMANGVPIANAADRGTLNARLPSLFPIEGWGRRAPWIVLGMPLNSVAGIMVLFPPLTVGSGWFSQGRLSLSF